MKKQQLGVSRFLFIWVVILIFHSCIEIPTAEDIRDQASEALYATALLNDTLSLQKLFSDDEANSFYSTDEQGRVTIQYNGEVLREGADIVFPPVYGIGDIQLLDTNFVIDFGMGSENVIDSAVIKGDRLHFRYVSTLDEPVEVTIKIVEIFNEDGPLSETISLPTGNVDKVDVEGHEFQLNGYMLKGNNNVLTLNYDARNAAGERVILDRVYVNLNVLRFDYLQGTFPKTVRPVEGNFIPVGLYDNWESGSMEFVNPKISIQVANSFGFPVGSKFNSMSLTTIEEDVYELESQILEEGIVFNYPSLDEIGEIKETKFSFDNDNSNLPIIFQHRIKQVNYNIDAIANPMDIPNFIGFMTSQSYYSVLLQVEIPMEMSINQLVLVDTFDLNLDTNNELIDTLELKLILENSFPVDIHAQCYLLDDMDNIIDSLFNGDEIFIEAAEVGLNGNVINTGKTTQFFNYNERDIDEILTTEKLMIRVRLHTLDQNEEPIWIYESYGLGVKAGAKFSLQ